MSLRSLRLYELAVLALDEEYDALTADLSAPDLTTSDYGDIAARYLLVSEARCALAELVEP